MLLPVAGLMLAGCASRVTGGPGVATTPAAHLTPVVAAVAYCAGGQGSAETFLAAAVKQGLLTEPDSKAALAIINQRQAASDCSPHPA